jgi:hypothetical protein
MSTLPPEIWVRILEIIPEYWRTDLFMVNSLFLGTVLQKRYCSVYWFKDDNTEPEIDPKAFPRYFQHMRRDAGPPSVLFELRTVT